MKLWCQLCREWVYEEHLQCEPCVSKRDSIRYHPTSPLCGDLWMLADGSLLLVDYKDSLQTGWTLSDGTRASHKYTDGFRLHLEKRASVLITTFEESGFPWCDDRGWSRDSDGKHPTATDSLNWISKHKPE